MKKNRIQKMNTDIILFTIGLVIALFVGVFMGYSITSHAGQYNGICWFEMYDEHMTGMRVRIYNYTSTYALLGIKSDCEMLKDTCMIQGPQIIDRRIDGHLVFGSNIPCTWEEEENTCACYPYRR